ncbi:Hypothetical Protein FCC1311_111222 [Hondaea fermentalgiana]|uniref:Uncharacterized protein n=1 Tax=Hondaea fermentalgiana TaxID=2315210 RepID=A0A2R5GX46_9STRA|nr:Hypothetical Protein FCC1311_111222 [Hondaea fermentalgiana]|eukprot:GBG34899.1 Hypothetical Protein FCC1311_111222 [Hondaea fermentalgiana]
MRIGDLDNTKATAWQRPDEDAALRTRGFVRIAQIISRGVVPETKRNKPKEYKISLILERMCYEHACTREEYENMRSFKVLLHRMAAEKAKRRTASSEQGFRYPLLDANALANSTTTTTSYLTSATRSSVLTPLLPHLQPLSRSRASATPSPFTLPLAPGSGFSSQGPFSSSSSSSSSRASGGVSPALHASLPGSASHQSSKFDAFYDRLSSNGKGSGNHDSHLSDILLQHGRNVNNDKDNHHHHSNNNGDNDGDDDMAAFDRTFVKDEYLGDADVMGFSVSKPPTPILPQLAHREQSIGSISSDHSMNRRFYPKLDLFFDHDQDDDVSNIATTSNLQLHDVQQQQQQQQMLLQQQQQQQQPLFRQKRTASGTPASLSRSSSTNSPMVDMDYCPMPFSGSGLFSGSSHAMLSPIAPAPSFTNVDMVFSSPGNEEPDATQSTRKPQANDRKPQDTATKTALASARPSSSSTLSSTSTTTSCTEAGSTLALGGALGSRSNSGASSSGGSNVEGESKGGEKKLKLSTTQIKKSKQPMSRSAFSGDSLHSWADEGRVTDASLVQEHPRPTTESQLHSGLQGGPSVASSGAGLHLKGRSHSDSNLPVFNAGGPVSGSASFLEPGHDGTAFAPQGGAASSRIARYGQRHDNGDRHPFRERTPRRRQSVAVTRFFADNNDARLQGVSPGNSHMPWSSQRCFTAID